MNNNPISEKRQKLINEKNASPLQVGETIIVLKYAVSDYKFKNDEGKSTDCTIVSLDDGITVVEGSERNIRPNATHYKIKKKDITCRQLLYIGANPFDENKDDIRPVAFCLKSILFQLNALGDKKSVTDKPYTIEGIIIKDCNWNPFIYDSKGNKQYYQRPFVWQINDNQLLIESIYQNIDCGKILVRKRSWEELEKMQKNGETELAFYDIVDGKQRLNAIRGFMQGEFADLQGNYYSDLSYVSQHKFTNHQLFSYAEMPEKTPDEDVLKQFLKLNFTGVPQSKEHILFVKSLINK